MNYNSINFLLFSKNSKLPKEVTFDKFSNSNGILLGLCNKGSAKIKINFKDYDLIPNTIMVLLPSQTMKIVKKSDDFLMETIYISKDFLVDLPLPKEFKILLIRMEQPCFTVNNSIMRNLLEYYYFIEKQSFNSDDTIYHNYKVKGILFSMIIEIMSSYNSFNHNDPLDRFSRKSRKEEFVDEFFKQLYNNLGRERSISFYADKLCISAKYLSSIIKEVTGRSILSWINEVFIREAESLLKNTNKTIIEISEELNISNPSFFCRLFKKQAGITPLEYRNSDENRNKKLYIINNQSQFEECIL